MCQLKLHTGVCVYVREYMSVRMHTGMLVGVNIVTLSHSAIRSATDIPGMLPILQGKGTDTPGEVPILREGEGGEGGGPMLRECIDYKC